MVSHQINELDGEMLLSLECYRARLADSSCEEEDLATATGGEKAIKVNLG